LRKKKKNEILRRTMMMTTSDKPSVKLIDKDGNVFGIIAATARALRPSGKDKEFEERAFNAESYDEVLRLVMEYCEVT
jgi:hypothetical protein